MILQSIRIDRFGGCSDLRLEGLADGIQVLHGPVGSGKRTLLQFLRSMLFGFDRETRQHYLPVDSRGFGGAITINTPTGPQTVSRYDDGGPEGRLTVEDADGRVIGHRQAVESLRGMTTERFDHLFAVDFAARPHVECLIANSRAAGVSLTAEAETVEISELYRQLEECQAEFRRLPTTTDALAAIQRQQRLVVDEIASLEARLTSGLTRQERDRLIDARDRKKDHLTELRRRLDELDEALRRAKTTTQVVSKPNVSAEVQELDRQIARWQGMVKEIAARRQSLHGESEGIARLTKLRVNPRRPLREIEQSVRQLQSKLASAAREHDHHNFRELRAEIQATLSNSLNEMYELCGELARWESNQEAYRQSHEIDQLARCEAELQHVIDRLVERRLLLVGSDSSYPLDWYEGEAHSRKPKAKEVWHTAASDAEIADLERQHQRTREAAHVAERELTDLNRQIASHVVEHQDELHTRLREKKAEQARLAESIRRIARRQELAEDIAKLQFEIKGLERMALRSPVHSEASRHLRVLSGGALQQLEIDSRDRVYAYDQAGRRFAWDQLDDGGRDQTYLSVLLAVHSELTSAGADLPLILHEAFSHLDAADAPAVAELLCQFARERQIVVLTRHQHVADVFTDLHVHVQTLTERGLGSEVSRYANRWAAIEDTAVLDSPGEATRYRLSESSPIEDAPSLSAAVTGHFRRLGIVNVGQFLDVSPTEAAIDLARMDVTEAQVRTWQAQAMLMCQVPDLRAYDARILVACDVADPEELRSISPRRLREMVQEFANSTAGQHLLLSGTEDELSRITDWMGTDGTEHRVDWAHRRPHRKSAQRESSVSAEKARKKRQGSSSQKSREVLKMRETADLKFLLNASDPVVDAPSIGPRTAERLEAIGIDTVHSLIVADPDDVAERLGQKRVNADTVLEWQQQTTLAIRVPQLRGHDAQILVALEITTAEDLAAADPEELWAEVAPFMRTNRGKRIIRNGRQPDLEEVTDWIRWAGQARALKAA